MQGLSNIFRVLLQKFTLFHAKKKLFTLHNTIRAWFASPKGSLFRSVNKNILVVWLLEIRLQKIILAFKYHWMKESVDNRWSKMFLNTFWEFTSNFDVWAVGLFWWNEMATSSLRLKDLIKMQTALKCFYYIVSFL